MGVSGEEPVTRREFDLYRDLAKQVQQSTDRELQRLDREIDLVINTHATDMAAAAQAREAAMVRIDARREQDLDAQRRQREEDQAEAQQAAEHKKEWSWQTKLMVFGLAIGLAGLWVQAIAAHK